MTANAPALLRHLCRLVWMVAAVLALSSAGFPSSAVAQAPRVLSDSAFAALVQSLSEGGGFFDTDNLISNEDSYLLPLSTLRRAGVRGGAYLGVGPDQNFSYIAATRPHIAFILDIRRDNLLEHLLFKAIFSLSRNRGDYLSLLFGLEPPTDSSGWSTRDIGRLLNGIDSVRSKQQPNAAAQRRVLERIRRGAIALSASDVATIKRFYAAFVSAGPNLQFASFNRAPQPYYPDLRRLLLERDRTGRQGNFLAHEADFQFVKSLEDRNLIVPVVGDFGGPHALAATGRWLRDNGETVSVFYTSNVEQYLFRDGGFEQFAASVAGLPVDGTSVFVRSYFMGSHPQGVAGYHATQLLQSIRRFVEVHAQRGWGSYRDLVSRELMIP